mmetsp:Transcript_100241/g.214737  ORF Transcript_100241/g.214737 Transcript_100241/m.214737 type:complete len:313 (-) Transcript_100241:15-953(-)
MKPFATAASSSARRNFPSGISPSFFRRTTRIAATDQINNPMTMTPQPPTRKMASLFFLSTSVVSFVSHADVGADVGSKTCVAKALALRLMAGDGAVLIPLLAPWHFGKSGPASSNLRKTSISERAQMLSGGTSSRNSSRFSRHRVTIFALLLPTRPSSTTTGGAKLTFLVEATGTSRSFWFFTSRWRYQKARCTSATPESCPSISASAASSSRATPQLSALSMPAPPQAAAAELASAARRSAKESTPPRAVAIADKRRKIKNVERVDGDPRRGYCGKGAERKPNEASAYMETRGWVRGWQGFLPRVPFGLWR